jgi:UDPglucose--hexose-1-phosphate uridylyltransferase
VVIESARHVESLTALSLVELSDVLATFVERLRHWRDCESSRYALVFKNLGFLAGASLSHVHSQLVALPEVPPAVVRELGRAEAEFQSQGACAYCRLLERERAEGARIVLERDGFVAFCPYASLQPFEVWLLPANHEPWFERSDSGMVGRLASVLNELLKRVEAAVPGAAYNLLLRTAPWDDAVVGPCHWRIEILPRVAGIAGFELATGMHINPLAPERAARHMR